MNLELNDKVVVVTGASRGIGRAIALGMATEAARVVAVARDKTALDKLVTEARARSKKDAVAVGADLSQLAEVERVVEEARRAGGGRIDVLVNNAGAIRGGGFLDMPDAQWLNDWSLKLMGYIRMARAVFPIMKAQGGGRIVNVVGAAARNPTATYLPGGAANAALVNFTKGLADLGAECGILVTAVSPAATRTERWDQLMEQQAKAAGKTVDEMRATAEAPYKLGRIATPEDIADLVCFLAPPSTVTQMPVMNEARAASIPERWWCAASAGRRASPDGGSPARTESTRRDSDARPIGSSLPHPGSRGRTMHMSLARSSRLVAFACSRQRAQYPQPPRRGPKLFVQVRGSRGRRPPDALTCVASCHYLSVALGWGSLSRRFQ